MAQYKGVLQVLLALCFFALLVESCPHGKCPENFVRIAGRCVKVLTDQMTGDEAYDECVKLGADLAVVDTSYYFARLSSFLIDNNNNNTCYSPTRLEISYWTAGHRDDTTGEFYWKLYTARTNKTKLVFLDGAKYLLSNNNYDEDCLEMFQFNGTLTFNDVPCNNKKIASSVMNLCPICETKITYTSD